MTPTTAALLLVLSAAPLDAASGAGATAAARRSDAAPPAAAPPLAAPPAADLAWDDAWLDAALQAGLADGAGPAGEPQGPRAAPPGGLRWIDRAAALALDALPGAQPLRRTIPSRPVLAGTLDAALERAKARAVLAAAAAHVGPERWRAVLDAHRVTQAEAAADADVLLEALAGVSSGEVAAAVRGLLERPGAPLLRAEARCGPGGPRVALELVPWRRAGGPGAVPACLRAGWARGEVTVCTVVAAPGAVVRLPFCPTWVWPNASGAGYYLSALRPGEPLRALPHLTAEERLALATDAAVLARHGHLPLEEAFGLIGPLARDADPRVVTASVLLARLVEPAWLADGERPAWRALLRRTYGPLARTLGWLPRPDDDAGTRQARSVLVPLVAAEGEEAVLAGEALALARRWLLERRQVPDEIGWEAAGAATRLGDRALLEEVAAAAARGGDAEESARLWGLVGRVAAPELVRAAAGWAAERASPEGEAALLEAALASRDGRDAAWEALQHRWDALAPRLDRAGAARLAEAAGRAACEPRRRAEVAAALGWRAAAVDGAGHALAFAFDEADACLLGRGRRAAAVPRFLAGR